MIPDDSIDMILCDLPYGTISCKWDNVIPFEPLWTEYNRIVKKNTAIVLFGSEPFSSKLRISNLKNYKYDWYWDKVIPSGMVNAKIQPMRQIETISVFSKGRLPYFPQLIKRDKPIKKGGNKPTEVYPIKQQEIGKKYEKTYEYKQPITLLKYSKVCRGSLHLTQKPVPLLEYLIKTYTQEGEVVLDNCMGSGSTGIACINTNRDFIGIELNEKYFQVAKTRIENAKMEDNNEYTKNR